MFRKKSFIKLNLELQEKDIRIQQLEDIVCPFNKHDYVIIEEYVMTDCQGGIIDAWGVRKITM